MKKYKDLDKLICGLRKDYSFGALGDKDCENDPQTQFIKWFEAALKAKAHSMNAAALATSGRGRASVRIVLIKGFDANGFVFYSSYRSRKAREIQANPYGEILFFWPEIERQVRISGKLTKISAARSDAYFKGRPRSAQISAWASHQSAPIRDRRALELRIEEFEKKFHGKPVPRPESWGGFCLVPDTYEFWQGRASRLNDRILYRKSGKRWTHLRIQP